MSAPGTYAAQKAIAEAVLRFAAERGWLVSPRGPDDAWQREDQLATFLSELEGEGASLPAPTLVRPGATCPTCGRSAK